MTFELSDGTRKMIDRFERMMRSNSRKGDKWVFILFCTLLILIMAFHEPWLDEAQSWLIARDASYYDMVFDIPHYEGHPPIWWLLLSVPAKLGLPYEISMKSIQWIFAVFAVALIIFKSPFPAVFRYLLPFTYFLFFHYGVISRPYSITASALMLCALAWSARNEKPLPFVLAQMLLCFSSAYGILIAGGISTVWVIEFLNNKDLFKNRNKLLSMGMLLITAMILIALIVPKPDTYAMASKKPNDSTATICQRFISFFFYIPAEILFTNYSNDGYFSSIFSRGNRDYQDDNRIPDYLVFDYQISG